MGPLTLGLDCPGLQSRCGSEVCESNRYWRKGQEKQELEEGAPACLWGRYQIELEIPESVCGGGTGSRERVLFITKGNFSKEGIINGDEP